MMDYNSLTEKQQSRYDRIANTAENMMYQKGFYKLSLTELTQKLKVSRSTIYEYFESKEGLVARVVQIISQRLDDGLDQILVNKDLTINEKFIQLAQEQSKNLNANCYRLLGDLKIHLPKTYNAFEERRKKRESQGYNLLVEEGISKGIFDPKHTKEFLVQLYLKMGQLISDTNILENISMNKSDAMTSIIKIFLEGTKRKN